MMAATLGDGRMDTLDDGRMDMLDDGRMDTTDDGRMDTLEDGGMMAANGDDDCDTQRWEDGYAR